LTSVTTALGSESALDETSVYLRLRQGRGSLSGLFTFSDGLGLMKGNRLGASGSRYPGVFFGFLIVKDDAIMDPNPGEV
jgi:hypothetical protein